MADPRQRSSEIPPSEAAAMEDRIRRYVDQRLQSTAEKLLEPPGFYARYRVELWGFLILFTLAAQWFWLVKEKAPQPSRAPVPVTAPSPQPPAATPPAVSTVLPPAATGGSAPAIAQPRLPWPEWLRAHPQLVKAGLDKMLAEEGVKKGSLSERQRTKAAEIRSDLTAGRTAALDTVHLGKLLFEYVAKRSQGAAAGGQIDAAVNDSEYPAAALERLASELAVPAADARLRKDDFHQELVMAWLEKNVPR